MIAQLAAMYGVSNVFDYKRPGRGLLMTSGTGGMLAGMDHLPMCGAAWVMEGLKEVTDEMVRFVASIKDYCPVVVVFAFYGVDLPRVAALLLGYFDERKIVVYSNVDLLRGLHVHTFDQMTAFASALVRPEVRL